MTPIFVRETRSQGVGGGDLAAPGAAGRVGLCLGFAAAPTFALMALWTGLFGGASDMLCASMAGTLPMDGMSLMYVLMSVFHLPPWLRMMRGTAGGKR